MSISYNYMQHLYYFNNYKVVLYTFVEELGWLA